MTIGDQVPPTPPAPQAVLAWAEFWYPLSWKCLLIVGAITAIGACVTIVFLVLHWRAASIRETQAEWRRSMLEYQVAQARREAKKELANVVALNVEAADLTEKNQSLEQIIRPRRLSSAQAHDIVAAWKPYSGRSVILWSYQGDGEAGALSEQIKTCLFGGRLVVVNNIGRMTSNLPPHVGIQIAGADKRLVATLRDALRTVGGLDATVVELPEGDAAEAVPAEIFVGTKPMGQRL